MHACSCLWLHAARCRASKPFPRICSSRSNQNVSQVAAQFAFTTLFGWHASRLLLATGSVWPAVAVHALCNVMGFPDFSGLIQHPQSRLLVPALLLGIVGFGVSYTALQEPGLHGNVGRGGGNRYVQLCAGL